MSRKRELVRERDLPEGEVEDLPLQEATGLLQAVDCQELAQAELELAKLSHSLEERLAAEKAKAASICDDAEAEIMALETAILRRSTAARDLQRAVQDGEPSASLDALLAARGRLEAEVEAPAVRAKAARQRAERAPGLMAVACEEVDEAYNAERQRLRAPFEARLREAEQAVSRAQSELSAFNSACPERATARDVYGRPDRRSDPHVASFIDRFAKIKRRLGLVRLGLPADWSSSFGSINQDTVAEITRLVGGPRPDQDEDCQPILQEAALEQRNRAQWTGGSYSL